MTNWVVGARKHTFEMHGRGISAFINPDPGGSAGLYQDGRGDPETLSADAFPERHKQYGFFQENRHFVDCLRNRQLPQTHFGDAVRTMELVEAVYRNAS